MAGTLPKLATIVTTDFSGITRGRPVRADRLEKYRDQGIGWVPANISLTPFNVIADPNPWGSQGDLRILPDLDSVFETASTGAATPFMLVPGNIVELDGTPWCCCSRTILKDAIGELKSITGFSVLATFEQEFQVFGADFGDAHAFSVHALRRAGAFGPEILGALEEAGVEPEMFLAEYGEDQFEITSRPAPAMAAADRAVAIREIVREIAVSKGWKASFAPKTKIDGVGNGVHIHLSLIDDDGKPVLYDPSGPGSMSDIAGSFAAGIVRHMRAITLLTAPSVPSYYRLKPHYWSASWTWLGEKDREASLRICPVVTIGGKDPASQYNFEFRAADATANPYLSLAMLIRAGLAGIRERLAPPPVFSGDPALLSDDERSNLGLQRLPDSLPEAISAFESDQTVVSWFDPLVVATFTGVRWQEIKQMEGKDDAEICRIYRELY